MECPSCNSRIALGLGEVERHFMRRFAENGFCISREALEEFLRSFVEHFGEVNEDDVDELCHFVEKVYGVRFIVSEHVRSYFDGF